MFPPGIAVVALVGSAMSSAGLLLWGRLDVGSGSARLAAAGLVVSMAVTLAGLVVGRGRWAQRHGWFLVAIGAGLTVASRPVDVWWAVSLGVAVAGALSLAHRSVGEWLATVERRTPLPTAAVLMMVGLLNVPLLVGLVHPDSLPAVSLVGALAAWVLLWAYSQAWVPALFALRLGAFGLAVMWAWGAPWWGWAAVATMAVVVTATAWTSGALLAAQPLEPRKVAARPILAELAPEDVRRVAGIDEKGRSL